MAHEQYPVHPTLEKLASADADLFRAAEAHSCRSAPLLPCFFYREGEQNSWRHVINGCSSEVKVKNGPCSGHGCCQADIPKGVRLYKTHFSESHNTTDSRYSSRCSYLVVMEEASFDYSNNFSDERSFHDRDAGQVPVVMDWVVKQGTCTEAQYNRCSYTCLGSRSDCLDSDVELGYRCRCSKGYEGNPYILTDAKILTNASTLTSIIVRELV